MAAELTLTGWLTIPAAEQDRLLPLLAEHIGLTRAEPGCLAFSGHPHPGDPDAFRRRRALPRPRRLRRAPRPRRRLAVGRGDPPPPSATYRDRGRRHDPHRCAWAGADPLMQAYHDEEWGVPERDARALWEKLVLDGFQAGLAWITILRKRETLRAAFAGFDPAAVARFGEADVARLLADPGIIRSRAKIEAAIGGARIYSTWPTRGEDFAAWAWSFTDGQPLRGDGLSVPASTAALRARSRRTSSAAASSSSARPSSTPGCRPWASSTTTPPTASAATRPEARRAEPERPLARSPAAQGVETAHARDHGDR